jgi:spore maturation protein CgeB
MPSAELKSVVVLSQGNPPLGRYLAEALNARGIKATLFCTDQNTWFDKWVIHTLNKQLHNLRLLPKSKNLLANHRWAHRNHLNMQFQKLLSQQKFDLILAVRGINYCHKIISRSPLPKVAWWVEPVKRVNEIKNELSVFNWCYSMNEESLNVFHQSGFAACSYMPHMFSKEEFFPIEGLEKSVDLVFVGNWNPRRQRYIDAAMEVTNSIVLYGKDWLKKNWTKGAYWRAWKGPLIQGQPLNRLYNQAKVVLNVTQWEPDADGRASGMNMRFFEVPATKSLFMTDRVVEAESLFQANRDYIDFGDIEDFKKQLRQILAEPGRRDAVANSGYLAVQRSNASYQLMVADMIARYEKQFSASHLEGQE